MSHCLIHSSMLARTVGVNSTMGMTRQPPVPLQGAEKVLVTALNWCRSLLLLPANIITPMLSVPVAVLNDLTTLYRAHCSTAPAVLSNCVGAVPLPVTSTTPPAVMLHRCSVTLAEKLAALSMTSSTLAALTLVVLAQANRSMSAAPAVLPASNAPASRKVLKKPYFIPSSRLASRAGRIFLALRQTHPHALPHDD